MLLLYVTSFVLLGTRPFADYDEAIYAQVAREASQPGGSLAFTWKGNVGLGRPAGWYEKPPLMIWLTEVSVSLFGRNELATRLCVLGFAICTVLLTGVWIRASLASTRAAVLTFSAYLVAFQFLLNTSVLQFDIPIGFFVLLALFGFDRAEHDSRYYYLFWFSVGIGVLIKSVIGLLPIPIAVLAAVLSQHRGFLRSRSFYRGILFFVLIIAPWHVIETARFGVTFWNQYFGYHVLKRWSSGLEGNGQPLSFYLRVLSEHPLLFAVWVPAVAYCLRLGRRHDLTCATIAIAPLFILLFFSSASTKLPAYILIIYPYMASGTGIFLSSMLDSLQPKLGLALTLGWIAIGAGLAGRFVVRHDAAIRSEQYSSDSRAVGEFLASHGQNLTIYYYSNAGTKPSAIYYSDRVVYYLPYPSPKPEAVFLLISEVRPNFPFQTRIFSESTQAIYLIN